MRYLERYHHNACKLLLTLSPSGEISEEKYWEYCEVFQDFAGKNLRKSDLVMQFRRNQFFVFLTDVREDSVIQVLSGLLRAWDEAYGNYLTIIYEVEYIGNDTANRQNDDTLWVAIVDDDMQTLRMAGNTLSRKNIRVSALRSGKALLEFLKENRPDLILLDVLMPEMDGFEVMRRLKAKEAEIAEIPVIFLTGDESEEAEVKGLGLGAVDFITREKLQDELARLHKETGKTFLLVTHDIEEAFKLGDRVIIMNEGTILFDGLRTMNTAKILWGSLLSAVLAVGIDRLLILAERKSDRLT